MQEHEISPRFISKNIAVFTGVSLFIGVMLYLRVMNPNDKYFHNVDNPKIIPYKGEANNNSMLLITIVAVAIICGIIGVIINVEKRNCYELLNFLNGRGENPCHLDNDSFEDDGVNVSIHRV